MSVNQRGFSLVEVLIAMTISSVVLLASARFLPALQRAALRQTQQQALEEEVWQRLLTVGRYLQRAGFCRGACKGEGLTLTDQCVLIRWDSNLNGKWEDSPPANADVTGFRLSGGALETLRGATSCTGKGWERMTDADFVIVDTFSVTKHNRSGFAPEFELVLNAHLKSRPEVSVSAGYGVTGHNL